MWEIMDEEESDDQERLIENDLKVTFPDGSQ